MRGRKKSGQQTGAQHDRCDREERERTANTDADKQNEGFLGPVPGRHEPSA